MSSPYFKIRYRPYVGSDNSVESVNRGVAHRRAKQEMSDQDAARQYLREFFRQHERNEVRALAGETRNNKAQTLRYEGIGDQLGNRIVKFVETRDSIPIFGSHVMVELSPNQDLISITGRLTCVEGVDSDPKISTDDAISCLKQFTRSRDWTAPTPERSFYLDSGMKWHLVYLFRDVPATPRDPGLEVVRAREPWSFRGSSRLFEDRFNYFVDAHDGSVVDYYPAAPAHTQAAAQP